MSDYDIHTDLGELKGRLDTIEKQLTEVRATLAAVVRELAESKAQIKGGWFVLTVFGGIAASVGATLASVLPTWFSGAGH